MKRFHSATWWMAILFAGGSACFVVASLPGFVQFAGSQVVGVVYFVGSLQFTAAAAIQWLQTIRRFGVDWWSSAIQFAGTLLFNRNTYDAMQEELDANAYDRLVWTPDVLGSICFLVSSYLAYAQVTGGFVRRPRRGRESAIATLNLGGSVAFGIAANRVVLGPDVRIGPRPGGRQRIHRPRGPLLPRGRTAAPPAERGFIRVG